MLVTRGGGGEEEGVKGSHDDDGEPSTRDPCAMKWGRGLGPPRSGAWASGEEGAWEWGGRAAPAAGPLAKDPPRPRSSSPSLRSGLMVPGVPHEPMAGERTAEGGALCPRSPAHSSGHLAALGEGCGSRTNDVSFWKKMAWMTEALFIPPATESKP